MESLTRTSVTACVASSARSNPMHTFPIGPYRFHHNGDFSGDVIISDGEHELKIPCLALMGFATEVIRSKQIAKIEDKLPSDILGFDINTL